MQVWRWEVWAGWNQSFQRRAGQVVHVCNCVSCCVMPTLGRHWHMPHILLSEEKVRCQNTLLTFPSKTETTPLYCTKNGLSSAFALVIRVHPPQRNLILLFISVNPMPSSVASAGKSRKCYNVGHCSTSLFCLVAGLL